MGIVLTRPNDLYRGVRHGTLRSFPFITGFANGDHTTIGQIINAHPNALVVEEARIFEDLGFSPSREETIDYLIARDRVFSRTWYVKDSTVLKAHPAVGFLLRAQSRRDFRFPGLSQGYVKLPSVIGNSCKADGTLSTVTENPEWISSFESSIGIPVKLVNVVRNPYDIIASQLRAHEASFEDVCSNLETAAYYVSTSRNIVENHRIITVRQENLATDPATEVRRLFEFLELPVNSRFLKTIAGTLAPAPNKPKSYYPEIAERSERVDNLIARHDFFAGYSYKS